MLIVGNHLLGLGREMLMGGMIAVHKKRFLRQLGMQEPFPNVARYYWAYLKGGVAPAEGTQ